MNIVEPKNRRLDRTALLEDPFDQFGLRYNEVQSANIPGSDAMVIATASAEGRPSVRVVFLKEFDGQVRIEGTVRRTAARKESEQHFATCPRESRIRAWISRQGSLMSDRHGPSASAAALKENFSGQEIRCPDSWGGYRLGSASFEFRQGRSNRLHDRILNKKDEEKWIVSRMFP
jgi:pyridoxamine 5'-phosphate oxidase